MDTDLAIERTLVFQHVYTNPSILTDHTFKKSCFCIPKLIVPPYIVDFGYVILDNVVHFTGTILNYGPVRTLVRLLRIQDKDFEAKGNWRTCQIVFHQYFVKYVPQCA